MEHRGATGADPLVGDGAGMLVQIPHDFFYQSLSNQGYKLPDSGEYAVGFFFFPKEEKLHNEIKTKISEILATFNMDVLYWRKVPVDNSCLSKDPEISQSEPTHFQAFFSKPEDLNEDEYESTNDLKVNEDGSPIKTYRYLKKY